MICEGDAKPWTRIMSLSRPSATFIAEKASWPAMANPSAAAASFILRTSRDFAAVIV